MKIAVIGAGVSGLVCAYLLHAEHEVTVYESAGFAGGHTNTIDVDHEGRRLAVDTGFIVFNERNYPQFCRLMDRLGVASRESTMSFGVASGRDGLEYGGASLRALLAQPGNLVRPGFLRMVRDIRRFGDVGKRLLRDASAGESLGSVLERARFSREFVEWYLAPMASSIWSAPAGAVMDFPAVFLLRFFDNHGMIDLRERPLWRTIVGGSREYVRKLLAAAGARLALRLGCCVERVRRRADGVEVAARDRDGMRIERHDEVIFAVHSDQALAMLSDATGAEREILGAMPYQGNRTVLHRDERVLPRRRAAWSAWNYRMASEVGEPIRVTYDMTILQGLATKRHLCVTLNDEGEIDAREVLGRFEYSHPIYTMEGERARTRWREISGVNRTHYCGAYWGNGFHEDGVASATRVCARWGAGL